MDEKKESSKNRNKTLKDAIFPNSLSDAFTWDGSNTVIDEWLLSRSTASFSVPIFPTLIHIVFSSLFSKKSFPRAVLHCHYRQNLQFEPCVTRRIQERSFTICSPSSMPTTPQLAVCEECSPWRTGFARSRSRFDCAAAKDTRVHDSQKALLLWTKNITRLAWHAPVIQSKTFPAKFIDSRALPLLK